MPLCRAWGRGVMRPFSTFALGFILKLSLEIPNGVIGRRGGDVQPVSIVPLRTCLSIFPSLMPTKPDLVAAMSAIRRRTRR